MTSGSFVKPVVSIFQGNGHERDFMDDEKVYIMDVYNRQIYPHDGFAKSKYGFAVCPFRIKVGLTEF